MLDFLNDIFDAFADFLRSVLPLSPFQQFLDQLEMSAVADYIGYINWIFPVGNILVILLAWLGCLSVYYMWSILLRWIRAIG